MTLLVEYVYKRFLKKAEREREREQSIDTILSDSAYHVSAAASGFTQE